MRTHLCNYESLLTTWLCSVLAFHETQVTPEVSSALVRGAQQQSRRQPFGVLGSRAERNVVNDFLHRACMISLRLWLARIAGAVIAAANRHGAAVTDVNETQLQQSRS